MTTEPDMIGNVTETDTQRQATPADAVAFNMFAVPDGYIEAPHIWFRMLRDDDPVHLNSDGSFLITRYEDVRKVWRDLTTIVDKSEQFLSRFGQGPLLEHHTTGMLFRDPPSHDRLRKIVNPFFTTQSMASLRSFIEETAQRLISSLDEHEEVEFVSAFAFQLTIEAICRMLGVPVEDGPRIQQYGKRLLFPLNPAVSAQDIADGHKAVDQFKDYLSEHLERVRGQPSIDKNANILSALVDAERSGAEISEIEILHMCILLINGGHESTTNLMSMSIHSLIDNPDQLALMRNMEDDVDVAIQELIRFISPIQLQGRRTTRPTRLSGIEIPADTELVFGVGAANRDDRIFTDPDTLQLERRPNPHLGFGSGVHMCIGRALAKLETSIALPAIIRHFAKIERAGPAQHSPSLRFRGLKSLPLRMSRL